MQQPEIQVPYNYSPRSYQLEYLTASQRFKILVFHRRAGKSKTLLNEQIRKALMRKGIYYYFLPTYRSAKAVIWDSLIKEHLPPYSYVKVNESELAIYYKNGSIQRFAGAEDYDKHRGINPIDVVLDEYSEHNERIWTEILRPVLAENHGTASFGFTPKGRNHSWKLLEYAKHHPEEWFWSVKGVQDTNALTEEEIDKEKEGTPQALFEQEWNCSFLDNAGAFFRRVKENIYYETPTVNPDHYYQIGVDLAKYNDWTVLTPFDLNTFKVYTQDRFNQVDWNLQKARIEAMAYRFGDAKLKIDRTGVGDPIVEDLRDRGLNIDEEEDSVVFTEKSKKLLLNHLAVLLEQDKIKIPYDEGLISELESMQYKYNKNNKLKMEVPDGMTDDRIMSLALAVKDAMTPMKDLRILKNATVNTSNDIYAAI